MPQQLAVGRCPCYDAEPPAVHAHRRRRAPPTSASAFDMHDLLAGLVDADSFFEVKPLFAPELIVGFGAARRATGRHRRQQLGAQGWRAVRRLRRQGGPLHLVLRRVRDPAGVPGRRARVHGGHRGRAPGDHPPRRQDDHRGVGGHGPEAVGDRAQGLRRRSLRVRGPGVRARGVRRAADGADRGDGPGGRDQRGVRQQDRGHRRPERARASSSPNAGPSSRPTSTCCGWRRSS